MAEIDSMQPSVVIEEGECAYVNVPVVVMQLYVTNAYAVLRV